MKTTSNRGFTLIELLVVIAIIGILSSVVLASLNSARSKARDAQRLSDLEQIGRIMALATGTTGTALAGCTTAHADIANCTGTINGVDMTQLQKFKDPSTPGTACSANPTATCQYSIARANGAAGALTDDYVVTSYLEVGAGPFATAGRICVIGNATTTGSLASTTCL